MTIQISLSFALWMSSLILHVIASTHRRTDDVDVQSLMALVQQQSATIQRQEASLQAMQTQIAELQHIVVNHTANLNVVNSQLKAQVAFTAYMSKVPVTMGTDSPLKFDAVVNNIGGAYNSATGVFTAPVSGLYVLYAKLMKHGNTPTIHWALDKSGTILCMNALDAPNNLYDKSSCLSTARLQKGEQVFVRRTDGDFVLEGSWWCSFSGYLLSMDV